MEKRIPPIVPFELGCFPYSANQFLAYKGLSTKLYNN